MSRRTTLTLAATLLVPLAASRAADLIQPQKGNVSASGRFVPVPLDEDALGHLEVGFPANDITVRSIPFDLVRKEGVNHLFLKSAEWPEWKEDPSSYYSLYDKGGDVSHDPRRPMFKIPVADYSAVHLLAACDNDPALSQVVSFRIGAFDGPRRTTLHDYSAIVPRFADKRGVNAAPVLTTASGSVFAVRIPLEAAIAQDFADEWALDVEVTKELRLAIRRPDPCRFQMRPLGPPSGVRIFGMTFERSPVQMKVTSEETGHVFVEPQTATFHVTLCCVAPVHNELSLEAIATDASGEQVSSVTESFAMGAGNSVTKDITLPLKRRGYHALRIRLMNGRSELLHRDTTFAMLPPDTRKHREQSPFGTWDFGGVHYTPNEADAVGPLYVKAGLRYGMFAFDAAARRKYGVLAGHEPRSADELAKRLEADPLSPQRVLIFHEHAISAAHVMRTPDVFTGRSPYKLNNAEQEKFDAMWREAKETASAVRARFPQAKIAFGNGNPHLMEEFARRKFPKELFDSRGNEAGSFMRMPETQPLDFVANNASLWMDRQILDRYGYQDTPITQCYEICYPGSNPGNLTLRTQADYYVRHMIHSLVAGIPIIRPAGICDVGNSYYFSNWGSSGLCFAKPELSPKPAYVAVATLTAMLDGAALSRTIETGSPVVYAVEFKKQAGGFVTVAWTVRGERAIRFAASEEAEAFDVMSNAASCEFLDGAVRCIVSASPIFIASRQPLGDAELIGSPRYEARPLTKSFLISSLAKLEDWRIDAAPDTELEWYNFECPRRKGDFEFASAAELEGEKQLLRVAPRLPVPGSPYLPMYASLRLRTPVEIPGKPTEIGLMVNGNGGWGRILFEFEDVGGQRWTSIGAASRGEATRWMADWMSEKELAAIQSLSVADWNTNDPWQRSRINFEGWRRLRFPLPGHYDGEGYHWPYSSQWKCTGDGVVKYPLKFQRLIIELPEKVLHLNRLIAAPRAEVYLKDLSVTYEPPEKAFVAE